MNSDAVYFVLHLLVIVDISIYWNYYLRSRGKSRRGR